MRHPVGRAKRRAFWASPEDFDILEAEAEGEQALLLEHVLLEHVQRIRISTNTCHNPKIKHPLS